MDKGGGHYWGGHSFREIIWCRIIWGFAPYRKHVLRMTMDIHAWLVSGRGCHPRRGGGLGGGAPGCVGPGGWAKTQPEQFVLTRGKAESFSGGRGCSLLVSDQISKTATIQSFHITEKSMRATKHKKIKQTWPDLRVWVQNGKSDDRSRVLKIFGLFFNKKVWFLPQSAEKRMDSWGGKTEKNYEVKPKRWAELILSNIWKQNRGVIFRANPLKRE